jgi:hypothetical protein
MKCESCKYWLKQLDEWADEKLLGARQCIKAVGIFEAIERNDDGNQVLKHVHKNTKIFVDDCSGYSASLLTKPDFFCAHYEKRG